MSQNLSSETVMRYVTAFAIVSFAAVPVLAQNHGMMPGMTMPPAPAAAPPSGGPVSPHADHDMQGMPGMAGGEMAEIGRASCRERVCAIV